MKFALLGYDPEIEPLLAALAASREHELTHVLLSAAEESSALVARLASGTRVAHGWPELLTTGIDMFVVAGADPEILSAAARLASDGQRLAVLPHACQPAEWVYELALTDHAERMLVPVFQHRVHPSVLKLRGRACEPSFGKLLHLRLERRHGAAPPNGTRENLDAALLADIDLLRMFGGEYSRVTATFHGAGQWQSASVAFAGEGLPDALWRWEPAEKTGWTLSLVGESDRLEIGGDERRVSSGPAGSFPADAAADHSQEGAAVLTELETALRGEQTVFGTWSDYVRDVDLLAAAHRSVRRGRTIDVHFETTSERSQFKTQMTAVGCGLLVFTLLAVVVVLVLGAILDPRSTTEIAADAANAVVTAREFRPDSDELTAAGKAHVADIAARAGRLADRPFPVLVEAEVGNAARWNEPRRNKIAEHLAAAGVRDAQRRTVSAPIRGTKFNTAMRIARIAVWVPLCLFLLLQVLVFVARPASGRPESADLTNQPGSRT